ncbi:hypothetical protein, partial [Duganella violaceipulchra]
PADNGEKRCQKKPRFRLSPIQQGVSNSLTRSVLPAGLSAARFDEYGIAGLTSLLFVSAYWMIPRALELSLTSPVSEAAKFGSLVLLGLILPGSIKRCPWVVQLFFLGNFGAMMAIAGMQYQSMPQRLCNAYLLEDQDITGLGLVVGAILISIAWFVQIAPALSPTLNTAESNDIPGTEHRLDNGSRT